MALDVWMYGINEKNALNQHQLLRAGNKLSWTHATQTDKTQQIRNKAMCRPSPTRRCQAATSDLPDRDRVLGRGSVWEPPPSGPLC